MMEVPDDPILEQIQEGMEVYARDGKKVGTVEYVKYGQEDPTKPGPETATVEPQDTMDRNLISDIAEALAGNNEPPEELRDRLLRYGYIKVDPGLLASDRYVLANQIASVTGDRVELRVTKDDLVAL